ncbi:Alcohol dehydrogenase, iron-type, conserved site [Acididesulfobacillus acetoxydans]|uniref:Alcohol dehydrogenase, iron-type, conserved site n=1 Tax=Acididesulfobacillus acetoxydans TaxID=1561005 RepID=A0A8S0W1X7_9FIRM|nr:iron-containing alcohol dehydrogenase [Acididesulfobacillus acetoxydans]CAA7600098.1 Alcohol dehydrogenase, iron-type, conserved site [Acididesulfobacillus acetoxydans]CEJ07658.1 NADH-dependent butanol dehydrogenase A [Acididesulfobacillus acetoxydans]
MLNFNYRIPTEVFFGEGQLKVLGNQIRRYGSKLLLVYGGGSIKKMGLYANVIELLQSADIPFWELSGVEPNPRVTSVRKGIDLCRKNEIDFILAVGGGSTIDCAKIIAAGFYYSSDPWDLMIGKAKIEKALPLGTILTLAATGSEMDPMAVISNPETHQKVGIGHPSLSPVFSILDPTYTFSVPKNQTAAGTADIMSHVFESYFSKTRSAFLQSRLAEGILKTCIRYGPQAMENPEDYEARANLMWASSLAINGLLSYGKERKWTVHPIEHELSAYYDITHGVGLAVLTPHWMEYVLSEQTVDTFKEYGVNVWGLNPQDNAFAAARQAIAKTREFFVSLGLPTSLHEINIPEDKLEVMARAATKSGPLGEFRPVNAEDVLQILRAAL